MKEKIQDKRPPKGDTANPTNGTSSELSNPAHSTFPGPSPALHLTNTQTPSLWYSNLMSGVSDGGVEIENISVFDSMQMDSMNDAWFTQQLSDLNWLDYYQIPQ